MDQVELERLVVKIGADSAEFKTKLAEINADLTKLKDKQEEVRQKTQSLAESITSFAGVANTAFNDVKAASNLMRGNFHSTGEALDAIGGIASSLPGPWGVAVSAILSVGGKVIDWFEGPLRKNQERARQGFMRIAQGATTVAHEVANIRLDNLRQSMERIAELTQQSDTAGGRTMSAFRNAFGITDPIKKETDLLASRTTNQQRNLDRLMAGGGVLRTMHEEFAVLQSSERMLTRAEEMPMHLLQRRAMRSLHGQHGDIDSSLLMMRQAEATRLARTGLMSYEQAMDRLAATVDRARYSLLIFQRLMTEERRDKFFESISTSIDKIQSSTETLGFTRHESMFHSLTSQENDAGLPEVRTELEGMYTALERINRIDPSGRSLIGQRQVLEGYIEEREAILELAEAQRIVLALTMRENEEATSADRNRTSTFQTQRQLEFLALQRDSIGAVVDMSKEEAALDALRARGAPQYIIQLKEIELGLSRELRTMLQAEREWNQIISRTVSQGVSVVNRFQDPLTRLEQQENAVQTAFSRNAITAEEATTAIQRLRMEHEGLNRALQLTPAVAAGSGEALDHLRAQQLSLRPLGPVELTTPISPPAPGASSGEMLSRADALLTRIATLVERAGGGTTPSGLISLIMSRF